MLPALGDSCHERVAILRQTALKRFMKPKLPTVLRRAGNFLPFFLKAELPLSLPAGG